MSTAADLQPRAIELNGRLQAANPAAFAALSPIALASYYPKDIPFQAAEAKGASYNATIGQITDGAGSILSVTAVEESIDLAPQTLNRALLYSPIAGHPDLRNAWNEYQTPAHLVVDGGLPCGPPLVTVGLTHAISLVADLFGGPGRDVVIPDPCWGNYVQVFGIRGGSRIHRAPSYCDGAWSWRGLRNTLEDIQNAGGTEPVLVVLNLPSNPGGFSPTDAERAELLEILVAAAEAKPVVVLCDDAYAGLVYDPEISPESFFWELIGSHPNLLPLRGAGSTKEFLLFGGRVGFLTLPFAADSVEFEVLEDKLSSLIRSSVGSPVSLSQMILLEALQEGETATEIAAVRGRLKERFLLLQDCLRRAPGFGERFKVLPCNSGAFVLLELASDLNAEEVRQRLLQEASTGVVAIGGRYIRLAFCSVSRAAIPALVDRVCGALG